MVHNTTVSTQQLRMCNSSWEVAKLAEKSRQIIDRLWDAYLESKGSSLKSLVTDKNRYELHLKESFGQITPAELAPPDVDKLRLELLKDHSNGTVRKVLELLR